MNKEEMEKIREYDLSLNITLPVYILYALYEWAELSHKMFEAGVFQDEQHRIFNTVSLKMFFDYRYGKILDSNKSMFIGNEIRTTYQKIKWRLSQFIGEEYKKPDSVSQGFFIIFKDEFFATPISQIMEVFFPELEYADPNLGCLNPEQFSAKRKFYGEKPRAIDLKAPDKKKRGRKSKKEKVPKTEPKIEVQRINLDMNKKKNDEMIPLKELNSVKHVLDFSNNNGSTKIPRIAVYSDSSPETFEVEKPKKMDKSNIVVDTFESIVGILTTNKIPFKETVFSPDGTIKISY